jgi:hypothetical protein
MSETKDSIRNAIQNLIKDNHDAAHVDLHPVITTKIQELVGTKQKAEEPVEIEEPESIKD